MLENTKSNLLNMNDRQHYEQFAKKQFEVFVSSAAKVKKVSSFDCLLLIRAEN